MLDSLERRFGLTWLSHNGDQINVRCPYCHRRGMTEDKSGHLGINTAINKVHCIRCDWGHGNAMAWLEKFDVHIAVNVVDVMREVDDLKRIFEVRKLRFDPSVTPVPRGFRRISMGQDDVFTDSLRAKGLTVEQMVKHGVGFCEEGKYDGYVIFPFYEEDVQVYFQGRAAYAGLLADPKTKKKNPPSVDGMGKNAWLYGIQRAFKGCRLVLVEGTLDQISLQEFFDQEGDADTVVVSLQGTSMSFPDPARHPLNSQWGKLAYFKPSEVLTLLDSDAFKKAEELAKIIGMTGFKSRAVRLYDGDPNEVFKRPDGASILRAAINGSEFDQITHTLNTLHA